MPQDHKVLKGQQEMSEQRDRQARERLGLPGRQEAREALALLGLLGLREQQEVLEQRQQ